MSDSVFEGKVLSIKVSNTSNGKFYRLEVEDDNGKDWFGMGNEAPDFGEGSTVSFDFTETDDGKFFNVDGDIEVVDHVEPKGRGGSRGNSGSRGNGRGNNSRGSGNNSRGSGRGNGSSRGSGGRGNGGSSRGNTNKGGSGSKGKGGKGETDWEAKDKRTALGFAREQAIKVLAAMIEQGAVTLPSKKAEKYDAYLGYLNELSAYFLSQADNYVNDGIEAVCGDFGDGEEEED